MLTISVAVGYMDGMSRHLELLKLEGFGLSQAEIVNQLSQKADCWWCI